MWNKKIVDPNLPFQIYQKNQKSNRLHHLEPQRLPQNPIKKIKTTIFAGYIGFQQPTPFFPDVYPQKHQPRHWMFTGKDFQLLRNIDLSTKNT